MQLQSERDRLAKKLEDTDRMLTEVVLFGFRTPEAPEAERETFSQ